jgi:hypothetical protein
MSIEGVVITPPCDTSNPVKVISLQASVGVADCVTVSVVHIVSPELEYPSGTVTQTVTVLLVSVSTIGKDEGVTDVTVPISEVGVVIVPSCATVKPLNVRESPLKILPYILPIPCE